jgi:sulfhydrogenase subunit gamma (sulfur reductase)
MSQAPGVSVPNPYLIHSATIMAKTREAEGIDTYRLRFADERMRRRFRFHGGQFNMLYLFGVGEVAISIVSDPEEHEFFDHTIRVAGRVTGAIANYRAVRILHGVKSPHDLLYRERFDKWRKQPDTEIYLTSDRPDKSWQYHVGVVTELFHEVRMDPARTVVLMCGPEIMMRLGAPILLERGVPSSAIHLSLERHMECGIGLCGHCQMGPYFLCKDGPVMRYDKVAQWLGRAGV